MASIPQPGAPSGEAQFPGVVLQDVKVSSQVASLRSRLDDPLPGGVSADLIGACASAIAASSEVRNAALAAPATSDPDLNQDIARAIVACALNRSRTGVSEGPDALYVIDARRKLVAAVALQLIPTLSIGGWLIDKMKGAAEAWGTKYGSKRQRLRRYSQRPRHRRQRLAAVHQSYRLRFELKRISRPHSVFRSRYPFDGLILSAKGDVRQGQGQKLTGSSLVVRNEPGMGRVPRITQGRFSASAIGTQTSSPCAFWRRICMSRAGI